VAEQDCQILMHECLRQAGLVQKDRDFLTRVTQVGSAAYCSAWLRDVFPEDGKLRPALIGGDDRFGAIPAAVGEKLQMTELYGIHLECCSGTCGIERQLQDVQSFLKVGAAPQ